MVSIKREAESYSCIFDTIFSDCDFLTSWTDLQYKIRRQYSAVSQAAWVCPSSNCSACPRPECRLDVGSDAIGTGNRADRQRYARKRNDFPASYTEPEMLFM
jgi:hypothetical protein